MKHLSLFSPVTAALRRAGCLAAALSVLSALGALPAAAQPTPAASAAVSAAEQLVFNEPHLQDLKPPQALRYRYAKTGPLEPGFEDEVQLSLRAGRDGGCCSAGGRFLSGERALALPEIEDASSNPVILYFLEHDVREMQRRTQGQSAYFRKRIRLAMVDRASVRDTVVRWRGVELPAQEVQVEPYRGDPMRGRYERWAGKQYSFVLARGVPGGVYQIRTRVPGAQPADPPALEETLTLADGPAASSPNRPAPGGAR